MQDNNEAGERQNLRPWVLFSVNACITNDCKLCKALDVLMEAIAKSGHSDKVQMGG